MSSLPLTPIAHPSAWIGAEMKQRTDWIVPFEEAELEELAAALAGLRRRGVGIGTMTQQDFPLPRLGLKLAAVLREVSQGRGFALLRGFPVERHGPEDLRLMYYGLSCHLGTPLSQNAYGDFLGEVYDQGVKMTEDKTRGYRTNEYLRFHTDRADIVGLFCFNKAKEGGLSTVTSTLAMYNRILAEHPEYLPVLERGFVYLNVEEGGDFRESRIPTYGYVDGVMSCRCSRNTIEIARAKGILPTPEEDAALSYFDSLAADPVLRLDMDLQRGDIQLINNHTTLHGRTSYVDDPDPALKRLMLRMWIGVDDKRPTVPEMRYNGVPKTRERKAA